MTSRRDVGRSTGAIGITLGINLVFGFVGYFIAFLFAYGFSDQVDPAQHVFFLILIGCMALAAGAVSALIVRPALSSSWRQAAALTISASMAINLLAVGIGSIISAQHKADGSVSAEFSTTTDVLVAGSLFGGAIIASWFAWRALPKIQS